MASFLSGFSFISSGVLTVISACLAYGLWQVYRLLHFVYTTPLRVLPGPDAPSFFYGNLKEISAVENSALPDRWFKQYGTHFVDRDFMMTPRLWSLDPQVIHYVLAHHDLYTRPQDDINFIAETLGHHGAFVVQGERHKLYRKIMNPAFGPAQVRDLTEVFLQKAALLRDIWAIATSQSQSPVRVNVNRDLSKTTLDIIGVAGFGYDFHALDPEGKPNELNLAFQKFLSTTEPGSLRMYLGAFSPLVKMLPSKRRRDMKDSSSIICRIGSQLVTDKKKEIVQAVLEKQRTLERKDMRGRDLLTLLMKANMATDIPEIQKMSDAEVNSPYHHLAEIPSFLLAGHESTNTAVTWALYALCKHPEVQMKLREHLLAVETEMPSMDELSALPYLDMFVRETMRLYSPVTAVVREARKDDVIPLSKPATDRYGNEYREIRIAKGNMVVIPVSAMHRSKEVWGEDALEFKTERWLNPPEAISAIPGVWGHLLTFIGGPRACIGYRFSLVEMKALLFMLVREFEFEFAVPVDDIVINTLPFRMPSLRSAPEEGYQLPLLIKPYKAT
ncbi:cytochrome P450 [Lenzites betulinus]|nr:cytochrome P450 [Lenzites betulinus]